MQNLFKQLKNGKQLTKTVLICLRSHSCGRFSLAFVLFQLFPVPSCCFWLYTNSWSLLVGQKNHLHIIPFPKWPPPVFEAVDLPQIVFHSGSGQPNGISKCAVTAVASLHSSSIATSKCYYTF